MDASRQSPTSASSDDPPPKHQRSSLDYENLNEVAAAETNTNRHLEDLQSRDPHHYPPNVAQASSQHTVTAAITKFYTLSHLVFFALLGTLARVGLTALTNYTGAPVFPTVWANVGGSLIMGFLTEDRKLFLNEWGRPVYDDAIRGGVAGDELVKAKKAHLAAKKTIPLYVGMATGFCGSFTSFSTFIRDVFLALSNDLTVPGTHGPTEPRNGGYSFMALLAVLITDVTLSLGAYTIGTHLAGLTEGFLPSIPFFVSRKIIDRAAVVLGWGCWLGSVFLAIFPPWNDWRGKIVFSLVFAPIGCLARFYLAMYLNAKKPSFPLGTFAANILGTMILAGAWDVAHATKGFISCQVMQGLEDGLCGCLTTVSTWVAELHSLKKLHSYIYGTASVLVALASMVIIMGSLRWTEGLDHLYCTI